MNQTIKQRVNLVIDLDLYQKAKKQAKESKVRLSYVFEKALEHLFQAPAVSRRISDEEVIEKMDKVVEEYLQWKKSKIKS